MEVKVLLFVFCINIVDKEKLKLLVLCFVEVLIDTQEYLTNITSKEQMNNTTTSVTYLNLVKYYTGL